MVKLGENLNEVQSRRRKTKGGCGFTSGSLHALISKGKITGFRITFLCNRTSCPMLINDDILHSYGGWL